MAPLNAGFRCRSQPGSSGSCSRRRLLAGWGASVLSAWGIVAHPAQSRAEAPTEYQIKAAFLFNFAKFVEWPERAFARADSPIVIGVLGDDPFGADLDRLVRGKRIENRTLVVRRFQDVDQAGGAHVLFISSSEQRRLPAILAALRTSPVLTVGEVTQFNRLGGIIKFAVENKKVLFDINPDAAERARLQLRAQLLRLARKSES